MTKKVGVFDVQSEINKLLNDYGDEVIDALKESIDETAKESVSKLKQKGDFKGRKYKSSWKSKNEASRLNYGVVIFNEKHYRLTHLLEFGHVKQNGGRTRAFPHIAPVNDEAENLLIEKLERKLQK